MNKRVFAEQFLMVFLLFSLLFATEVTVVRSDTFACDNTTDEKLKNTINYVRENFRTKNVLAHVDKIELTIEKCKIDSGKFGFGRGIYDFWRKPSYPIAIQEKANEAFKASNYRNIDEEVLDIQELIRQDGKSYNLSKLLEAQAYGKAHPERCSKPVNVDTAALGAVRDQDSIGWCYAFTAADLLTHKTGQRISAADIATKFNDSMMFNFIKRMFPSVKDTNAEGGYVSSAIEKLQTTGACLENNFRSDDNGTGALKNYLDRIQTQDPNQSCQYSARRIFGNLKAGDLSDILKQSAREDVITNLANKSCQPRIDISDLKVITKHIGDYPNHRDVFSEIDKQLESGNITGISYFASVLYDKNNIDDDTGHASSIVGRRFNPSSGQCEYLVRNSYGRSCQGYDKAYECREGNVWLPQEQLVNAMYRVTYVE